MTDHAVALLGAGKMGAALVDRWVEAGRAVVEHAQCRSRRIRELKSRPTERRIELRQHRRHAARKINANHRVVRIDSHIVLQRQHARIIDTDDRDVVLRIGDRVGVGQVNDVAGLQPGQIEIESGLCAGRCGRSICCLVRQRAGHCRGKLVDLILRLHQRLVAKLEIGRDGA